MIQLIADSGSTKTHWVIAQAGNLLFERYTSGINPFYQDEATISSLLYTELIPHLNYQPDQIYFYGAGCSFPEKKSIVSSAIGQHFKNIPIEVQSDLLGAARGLLQHTPGVACILGTGSNSCNYNGSDIEKNVSPLGYILGDEGSGAVLGKQLVSDILKHQTSEQLRNLFFEKYTYTPAEILDRVYKQPFPNRFLAGFAPFLSANVSHSEIHNLVYNHFLLFFKRNVLQYGTFCRNIRFVGSIAFYFKEILTQAAAFYDLRIEAIETSPMNGLILYHSK